MAKKPKAELGPVPMTKEDCLQILSERDEKLLAQMSEIFQKDIKLTILEANKKRDDLLHQMGLTLQSTSEMGERLKERTDTLFDRHDEMRDKTIPQIKKEHSEEIKTIRQGLDDIMAYQNERKGEVKLYGRLCIGVAAVGAVGACLVAMALG